MAFKTPEQVSTFLRDTCIDLIIQCKYMGDEPNSYRKDWESSTVRVCLFACWAYEQAAGNMSIPLVYRVVNEAGPQYLADRSYFHSTPRDLRAFTKASIPMFGVESRHQFMDFDVLGTSISYPVLSINFVKQLMMSGIPPTWEDRIDHGTGEVVAGRHRDPEAWPFVIVGGQVYGAPRCRPTSPIACSPARSRTSLATPDLPP